MKITQETNIGQLVAADYRAAAVFKAFGIDFCCGGNRSIASACTKKQLKPDKVISTLTEKLNKQGEVSADYQSWDADLLADYIEKKHHRYVREKTGEIIPFLQKLCQVHGDQHPELLEIMQLFQASAVELAAHMQKEEQILFPYIRRLLSHRQEPDCLRFASVEDPVAVMEHEHEQEGERFRKIAALSNNYMPPEDACTTYRVTYAMLKAFEEDLHLHIHLENNILFPKAIELEKLTCQPA